jgi:hypothetical protein
MEQTLTLFIYGVKYYCRRHPGNPWRTSSGAHRNLAKPLSLREKAMRRRKIVESDDEAGAAAPATCPAA